MGKFSSERLAAVAFEVLGRNIKQALTANNLKVSVFIDTNERSIIINDDIKISMAEVQFPCGSVVPCAEVILASRIGDAILGSQDLTKQASIVVHYLQGLEQAMNYRNHDEDDCDDFDDPNEPDWDG
jgi:hypothetical protein